MNLSSRWWRCCIAFAGASLLVSCNEGTPSVPAAFEYASSRWTISYSPGMPAAPESTGQGWAFAFPVGPEAPGAASVHMVTTSATSLANSSVLTLAFTINESGDPTYQYKFAANNTCDTPANVSLYFQRKGDDMSGVGKYEFYRWFSVESAMLKPGPGTLSILLTDPVTWLSVFSKKGDAALDMFAQAKANLAQLGVVFGGGCFKGHGVNIDKGSSTFALTSFATR